MANEQELLNNEEMPDIKFKWHLFSGIEKDSADKLVEWGNKIAQAQVAKLKAMGDVDVKRLMDILVEARIGSKDATPTYSELLSAVKTALEDTVKWDREKVACTTCKSRGVCGEHNPHSGQSPTICEPQLEQANQLKETLTGEVTNEQGKQKD